MKTSLRWLALAVTVSSISLPFTPFRSQAFAQSPPAAHRDQASRLLERLLQQSDPTAMEQIIRSQKLQAVLDLAWTRYHEEGSTKYIDYYRTLRAYLAYENSSAPALALLGSESDRLLTVVQEWDILFVAGDLYFRILRAAPGLTPQERTDRWKKLVEAVAKNPFYRSNVNREFDQEPVWIRDWDYAKILADSDIYPFILANQGSDEPSWLTMRRLIEHQNLTNPELFPAFLHLFVRYTLNSTWSRFNPPPTEQSQAALKLVSEAVTGIGLLPVADAVKSRALEVLMRSEVMARVHDHLAILAHKKFSDYPLETNEGPFVLRGLDMISAMNQEVLRTGQAQLTPLLVLDYLPLMTHLYGDVDWDFEFLDRDKVKAILDTANSLLPVEVSESRTFMDKATSAEALFPQPTESLLVSWKEILRGNMRHYPINKSIGHSEGIRHPYLNEGKYGYGLANLSSIGQYSEDKEIRIVANAVANNLRGWVTSLIR